MTVQEKLMILEIIKLEKLTDKEKLAILERVVTNSPVKDE